MLENYNRIKSSYFYKTVIDYFLLKTFRRFLTAHSWCLQIIPECWRSSTCTCILHSGLYRNSQKPSRLFHTRHHKHFSEHTAFLVQDLTPFARMHEDANNTAYCNHKVAITDWMSNSNIKTVNYKNQTTFVTECGYLPMPCLVPYPVCYPHLLRS